MDDLRPDYAGDVKISYVPRKSERGIKGRKKYDLKFGMVLLDRNGDVFWKEQGLKFGRSKVKSKLDGVLQHEQ